jgi:hypothetical protein
MKESFVDLRKIQSLHKEFLTQESKLDIAFASRAIKAVLQCYKMYL